ncbi:MAG: energy transducer TonB [Bacteroidota bacterium]
MKNLIPLFLLIFLGFQSCDAQHNDNNGSESKIDTIQRVVPPPPGRPPPSLQEEGIFRVVEEMPRFPGCEGKGTKEEIRKCSEQEFTKFIYKNLQYPKEAREKKIEGTCVVQLTIEEDGSVEDVELVRDIGGGCGEEAVRVVELMNKKEIKWTSPKSANRPVKVRFPLPVKFDLLSIEGNENGG